jgi:hypothetical protein
MLSRLRRILGHPSIRPLLFSLLHPRARRGYPDNDLHPAVLRAVFRELPGEIRDWNLMRADYEAWRDDLLDPAGPDRVPVEAEARRAYLDYVGYSGPQLLDEKLLEHWVSLQIAQPRPGEVLVDIGSAASPFHHLVRDRHGLTAHTLDPDYPPGIHGHRIGAFAHETPLPDSSVDILVLHCALDHFEGDSDTRLIREAARLLRPGGRLISLPLYLSPRFANLTDPSVWSPRQHFDPGAVIHKMSGHRNRFGRWYSVDALRTRLLDPAQQWGLVPVIWRMIPIGGVVPCCYLRWALQLTKPGV